MNISRGLNKMIVPAVAAGLLLGGVSASQAQFFNYSTTFSDGTTTANSTVPGQTVIINTTDPGTFLTVAPNGLTTGANALAGTAVSVFTVTPTSGSTGPFSVTDTTYTYTFTLQRVTSTSGTTAIGAPVTITGTGTIKGTLDNSSDNVNIGPGTGPGGGSPSGVPTSVVAGGELFTISFDSRRNPGIPGSGSPSGGVTFFIQSNSVPEPGSVALLIGMGVSGSAFVIRKRRRA